MTSNRQAIDVARAEAIDALPAVLSVVRWLAMAALETGDPESEELKRLLEDCVVGALRLRLRRQLLSGNS
jgi:hypothetical protein